MTQAEFGSLVGVSQQAVGDMVGRGVLSTGENGAAWLHSYCSHLREVAAGRLASGDLDLATERAALARAQRERIEMQNAQTRGELAPVILIEEVLTKAASKTAGILDAIPGMVRRRVPRLTAEDIDMISGEVARARNMVAAMSLADLDDEGTEAAAVAPMVIEDDA